jgi:hypothetical protein
MDMHRLAPLYSHLTGGLARGPGELASPQNMDMKVVHGLAPLYSHLPGGLAKGPCELA